MEEEIEKMSISNKEIINGIAGIIYYMDPYHMPENMDRIMGGVNQFYDEKEDSVSHKKNKTFKIFIYNGYQELYKEIETLLKSIKEFNDLNISRKKKEQGVKDKNDKRNIKFAVYSIYDSDTKDRRYTDFIDLDACIQNIVNQIVNQYHFSEDCMLCKFAKEYGSSNPSDCEECRTCCLNPNYNFNRIPHPMSLIPLNKMTKEQKEKYGMNF